MTIEEPRQVSPVINPLVHDFLAEGSGKVFGLGGFVGQTRDGYVRLGFLVWVPLLFAPQIATSDMVNLEEELAKRIESADWRAEDATKTFTGLHFEVSQPQFGTVSYKNFADTMFASNIDVTNCTTAQQPESFTVTKNVSTGASITITNGITTGQNISANIGIPKLFQQNGAPVSGSLAFQSSRQVSLSEAKTENLGKVETITYPVSRFIPPKNRLSGNAVLMMSKALVPFDVQVLVDGVVSWELTIK